MTSLPPPPIYARTAADIDQQTRLLLRCYFPDIDARVEKTIGDPLVPIFAHFAELIIDRLNRAPEKNFLAFLDLIGASLLPPQPARVELTFFLLPGVREAFVPAGTQVAAPPVSGETEPVIFETEEDLTLAVEPTMPEEKSKAWASQYVTFVGEILGSSDGTADQTVQTRLTPVLPGQRLAVREPDLPPAAERETIEKEEKDAFGAVTDATGRSKEVWVRWHEVPDFYASGPRDATTSSIGSMVSFASATG